MEKIYGVYGASGFGREVVPLLEQSLQSIDKSKKNYWQESKTHLSSMKDQF